MRWGPTADILEFARRQPGGVIRWREARGRYLNASMAARADVRRGGPYHFHMALGKVLHRYFTKVEGTDGYYVLNESIVGED